MTERFVVHCPRCGESGTEKRMDIQEGRCFYCRNENAERREGERGCVYCKRSFPIALLHVAHIKYARQYVCRDCFEDEQDSFPEEWR